MTKDELLEMQPGPELDMLIAEFMGKSFRKPTHGTCCTCQICGWDFDNCQCGYSEDIDMAWQVMEVTKFDSIWRILQGSLGIRYCVGYARGVDTVAGLICYSKELHPEKCLSPICDTVSEAICKAALLEGIREK